MNYKLKTFAGDSFGNVSEKAKQIAEEKGLTVEFDFNGIKCLVSADTNLDWLSRDYMNAHTMGWETVGANCLPEYTPEVQAEMDEKKRVNEERWAKEAEDRRKENDKKLNNFKTTVANETLEFTSEPSYMDWRAKNSDPYGNATFEYAEGWAKLMQVEIAKGRSVADCADEASTKLGFMGISGAMYGFAVQILAKCWKHGEALRKWHNKEYDHEGDGVVNPSIITVKTK